MSDMLIARFGPAGNCDDFAAAGYKHSADMPIYAASFGLNAYEYQCGRGVRLSDDTAAALRLNAEQNGVQLSLHAPYFISLASDDPQKRDNSIRYILDSADAVARLGGNRIVVHPGGLGGLSREGATALASQTLTRAQAALDEAGLDFIHICPETMGKINQLGDLAEVMQFCAVDERFLPCIDFGHLNSRTHGGLTSRADYERVLDTLENALGVERARQFHAHFSKIEYTDGGEKRHLTFEDMVFGPDPAPLMQAVADRGFTPTFICESAGTQTRDAKTLMTLYEEAAK